MSISPGSDLVPVPGIQPGQEKAGWTEQNHLIINDDGDSDNDNDGDGDGDGDGYDDDKGEDSLERAKPPEFCDA